MPLPHRYPFRCVDRVMERHGEGSSARVRVVKQVSAGDAMVASGGALQASFWMAEMLAQAAAMGFRQPGAPSGRLVGIQSFEVLETPAPGDELEIEVWMAAVFGKLARIGGTLRCGTETLARGEITIYEEDDIVAARTLAAAG